MPPRCVLVRHARVVWVLAKAARLVLVWLIVVSVWIVASQLMLMWWRMIMSWRSVRLRRTWHRKGWQRNEK